MSDVTNLTHETYLALFGDAETRFDLAGGKIVSHGSSRQVLITTDTLHGIYRSLSHETGEAWKVVLKNCGYRWGKRVVAQLDRALEAQQQPALAELSVQSFCELIETYLCFHGWGTARIDLNHASDGGLVRVSLYNSIMVQALGDVSGTVDYLLSGMLRGVFEAISGEKLDCHQVTCQRSSQTGACEFVVSATPRVEKLEAEPATDSIDDAIRYLRAA